MKETYFGLGLMSGTSMDGVDVSIISSDGQDQYQPIYDGFFEYDKDMRENLHLCRDKIVTKQDITKYKRELEDLEKN